MGIAAFSNPLAPTALSQWVKSYPALPTRFTPVEFMPRIVGAVRGSVVWGQSAGLLFANTVNLSRCLCCFNRPPTVPAYVQTFNLPLV
jgi:hypothetical protein